MEKAHNHVIKRMEITVWFSKNEVVRKLRVATAYLYR
jgi:hypothetical protein